MGKEFEEEDDAARRERWAQRRKEMKRQKQRQELIRRISRVAIPVIAVLVVIAAVAFGVGRRGKTPKNEKEPAVDQTAVANMETQNAADGEPDAGNEDTGSLAAGNPDIGGQEDDQSSEGQETEDTENTVTGREYGLTLAENAIQLGDDIDSSYAIFVDREKGTILGRKAETARIVPASMTKVLTLLVAVENIDLDKLDDKFEITAEITNYSYVNGCTVAGFEKKEAVTIRDLLYGTILPSGADAALGLAYYVSGSQEAFVELMNEKLEELGLSETAHFTNCIGLYDGNHYCTAYDMAVIMQAAVENKTCREVMSAHTYTTSETEQHPEGILLSNWFLRRIEDKESGGEVICGKSGYVIQSKNCAVSYGVDKKGREYICVTASASGLWRCIYDHVNIYKRFSEME